MVQFYRSGRLPKLTDADIAELEKRSIQTVASLLTEDDLEVYGPDRLPAGARLVNLPIDSPTVTELANLLTQSLKTGDFSKVPIEMNPEIHRLLIHDGKPQYAELLELISDPVNRPLVFHCSHGVHRTGTGAALLLSALGVPWDTIREDYLLSNKYQHDEVQKRLGQIRQLAAEKRGVPTEQVDMTNMEAFLIQDGTYVDASRAEMLGEYGSVDAYLSQGLGQSAQDINQLQLLSIELQHVLAIRELPPHHSDPFDRLLLAQARFEGAQLVTADGQLSRYVDQVELLW